MDALVEFYSDCGWVSPVQIGFANPCSLQPTKEKNGLRQAHIPPPSPARKKRRLESKNPPFYFGHTILTLRGHSWDTSLDTRGLWGTPLTPGSPVRDIPRDPWGPKTPVAGQWDHNPHFPPRHVFGWPLPAVPAERSAKKALPQCRPENQESPRQTKPKKGQFTNFSRGHSGTKVRYVNRAWFPKKTPEFTKMGEIHELFVLALSLVWFAGRLLREGWREELLLSEF